MLLISRAKPPFPRAKRLPWAVKLQSQGATRSVLRGSLFGHHAGRRKARDGLLDLLQPVTDLLGLQRHRFDLVGEDAVGATSA